VQHGDSAAAKSLDVLSRGGAEVHVVVHRRRDDDWLTAGQRERSDHVVGHAMGDLRDRVGRGRREQVDLAVGGQLEVGDWIVRRALLILEDSAGGIGLELICQYRRASNPLVGALADEVHAVGRLNHAHEMARLDRKASELERFVRGDSAADSKENAGHGFSIDDPA
jgi:hypothetical protein